MITRYLVKNIEDQLFEFNKIVVLLGARQVGKTTMIKNFMKKTKMNSIFINADLVEYHEAFSSQKLNVFKQIIGDAELLVIDEAQNIPNIGINLKIMYDEMPELKIIVTGSSSFELANKIKEPLTGRTATFFMHPIGVCELLKGSKTAFNIKNELNNYLIFGMYPEVLNLKGAVNKTNHLRELTSSYLYKDVLKLSNIKHSEKVHKLLKLLAFQVGNLVSINEIAQQLGMSQETVNSYISLLEKGFIIYRLSSYSNNLRKEIKKKDKIYFNDCGVRNMLINNLNDLDNRNDIGALWENFLFMERKKYLNYNKHFAYTYFWRTYSGAEVDYIEEKNNKLFGYEFKWNIKRKARVPKTWIENYSKEFEVINKENFVEFVS